jgi:hypothetical protein
MYDYIIEEMADAIASELHVDNNDVLRVLHHYWEDKIAHVWRVDHIIRCAFNMGKPILLEHAVGLLDEVFQFHDSDAGIRWSMLEEVLRDYRLDFNRLSAEQYDEVQGVFKVWRQGNIIAHQIGLFPDETKRNLTKAIALARSMAGEMPNAPILIGCEPHHSHAVEPWLIVTQMDGNLMIEQKEPTCTQ